MVIDISLNDLSSNDLFRSVLSGLGFSSNLVRSESSISNIEGVVPSSSFDFTEPFEVPSTFDVAIFYNFFKISAVFTKYIKKSCKTNEVKCCYLQSFNIKKLIRSPKIFYNH
ncbi:hypothetical protein HanRHA438_Chr14g0634031 [Helianthus annuus]|nr:hypothetical protein HanRHA438_Chr14g0634031 [Helianthus annuus]